MSAWIVPLVIFGGGMMFLLMGAAGSPPPDYPSRPGDFKDRLI